MNGTWHHTRHATNRAYNNASTHGTMFLRPSSPRRKWLVRKKLRQDRFTPRGGRALKNVGLEVWLGLLPALLFLLPLFSAFLRALAVAGADLVLLQHLRARHEGAGLSQARHHLQA